MSRKTILTKNSLMIIFCLDGSFFVVVTAISVTAAKDFGISVGKSAKILIQR